MRRLHAKRLNEMISMYPGRMEVNKENKVSGEKCNKSCLHGTVCRQNRSEILSSWKTGEGGGDDQEP